MASEFLIRYHIESSTTHPRSRLRPGAEPTRTLSYGRGRAGPTHESEFDCWSRIGEGGAPTATAPRRADWAPTVDGAGSRRRLSAQANTPSGARPCRTKPIVDTSREHGCRPCCPPPGARPGAGDPALAARPPTGCWTSSGPFSRASRKPGPSRSTRVRATGRNPQRGLGGRARTGRTRRDHGPPSRPRDLDPRRERASGQPDRR